jgi:hypothetical protein
MIEISLTGDFIKGGGSILAGFGVIFLHLGFLYLSKHLYGIMLH